MSPAGKWFVAALLLVLHFALHPLWSRWPVPPDLLAGGLILGSLQLRWGRAAGLRSALAIFVGADASAGVLFAYGVGSAALTTALCWVATRLVSAVTR